MGTVVLRFSPEDMNNSSWSSRAHRVLARLRLENHHAAGQAKLGSTFAQALQNGLMPPVNPVEIADGGDATPMPGSQVMKTSNQLHTALLA